MTRLTRSAVLGAPVEQVWRLLRDFGGWHAWHPALASCRLEGGISDEVGAVRVLRLHVGEDLREQLIALSDRHMSCTWCLIEASTSLDTYVSTLRLRRITHEDRSFLEMHAQCDGPAARRGAAERLVVETLAQAALSALQARFRPAARIAGDARTSGPATLPYAQAQAPLLPLREKVPEGRMRDGADLRSLPDPSSVSRLRRDPPSPARGEGVLTQSREVGSDLETAAIVVERHGGPEVLTARRVSVPPSGPGEVQLRHAFIGVNMIDVHGRAGAFGLGTLPAIPGMEGAGTVLDVGPGVAHLKAGDRVVYAGRPPGAYADIRTLPADIVVPLPPGLDERTAAASFMKGITADLLLHDVHPLQPGELVLVHAAAGGLGLLLCGWARALEATVVGVVSRDGKVDAAAAAGCDAVIVSSREDVAQTVRELTRGRGVDVVYDAIGRTTFEASLASLAPRGHLVSFGQVSGPVGARDIDALAARSIRLSRPNFADYTDSPEALAMRADRLFAALRSGQVRPVIDSEWPLAQAADAHRRLESRDTIGSILLVPEPG